MYDIHPFMRPFGVQAGEAATVVKPYDLTGPFGEVPTYKWRMQDIMNAMITSNLRVQRIEEMYAQDGWFWVDDSTDEGAQLTDEEVQRNCDWHQNPMAALPQWLSVRAVKG
ncbi:hypothetical protein [Paenibacillus glycanilyticus]|nr:hypothetical protein [Paenibacillus glycanilyticus]